MLTSFIKGLSYGINVPATLPSPPGTSDTSYLVANTELDADGFVFGYQIYCASAGVGALTVKKKIYNSFSLN